ncbi:MAG: hypothetical protein FJ125_11380 [Deltaproteobacteria bacterium]|nr:hypothetical protein [Deltaproteobacteria bacterium]
MARCAPWQWSRSIADGTDWGEDDGQAKCGSTFARRGAWFVWLRESVHHCCDGQENGGETAVDCGGSCPPCGG